MARVGDEPSFALEAVLEPCEHRVERDAEPGDLVASRRHGQPLVERAGRDLVRPAAHRLDRAQCGAREQVGAERREQQRDRAADEERGTEAAQRLGPVLARRADDQHAVAERDREQPCRLVEPGHGGPVAERRGAGRRCELGWAQQARRAERTRRVEHPAVGGHKLGERLAALDQRAARRLQRAVAPHQRREVLRARAELLVECPAEVGGDPLVQEHAARGEDEGRRDREHGREPQAERNPAHDASGSRSRYPEPRTVSSESAPNGRSIFSRR